MTNSSSIWLPAWMLKSVFVMAEKLNMIQWYESYSGLDPFPAKSG